jgi:rhamnosyl/mannosyltransferase
METHLADLCTELRQSIDVRVLVAGTRRSVEIVAGVPITRLRTISKLASAPICYGMTAAIRASGAEIIHIHWPNPAAAVAYLRSGHRGPLVVTYHSDTVRHGFLGACFEPILHQFLRRSDAILVTSPDYLSSSRVLHRHRDRCHVVPLGIPFPKLTRANTDLIAKLHDKYGDRILLAVGRLVYYKGFKYLIDAMTAIDGKLLIVGEGPLRRKLEQLAVERGLKNRVIFLNNVPDTTPYYHACNLFVLPSVARSEAFGIVQVEAMAAGKPVINTKLDTGVPFVSLNQLTGLTVPPADSNALASAANQLLNNPALLASFGKAAHVRARTLFSVEAMARRTLETYEFVMSQANSQRAAVESVRCVDLICL